MSPVQNGAVLFNEIPSGYPIPGKTVILDLSPTIDIENAPLKGGILIKTLALSVDPYLRGKMRDPNVESYASAFLVGEPLYNYGVGRVLRSENPSIKVGDHVTGMLNFQEYSIVTDFTDVEVINRTEESLPWSVYLGAAGMPGRTAYFAFREFAKAQRGQTIFVSTGAGAVGAMVIQIAKGEGMKVIASAGSDAKVEYMKEIGADVAFNYKTTDTAEVLEKEGPLDVYWDNVGGTTFDTSIANMKINGQIIVCGFISDYNSPDGQTYKNLWMIFGRSLNINGFIEYRLRPKWMEEFYKIIPAKLASGEIKYREEYTHGLQGVGEAILKVQKGENLAKSIIVVAED